MYNRTSQKPNVYRTSYRKPGMNPKMLLNLSRACIFTCLAASTLFGLYWAEPLLLVMSMVMVGILVLSSLFD